MEIAMRKKRKLKVIYRSLWDTASPEQKKEYQRRLDSVYDYIFDKILEKHGKQLAQSRTKTGDKKDI